MFSRGVPGSMMPEPDAADAAYNEIAATKGSKTMKRITTTLCLAAMACVPALALAQRSTVDLGVAYNYMGSVVVEGPSGAGVPPRSSLEVGDATALMLNFEYRPTANLGLQLATSLGGTLKVDGVGGLAAQGRLLNAAPYSLSALVSNHFSCPAASAGVRQSAMDCYASSLGPEHAARRVSR
jgi:hypothetical protein